MWSELVLGHRSSIFSRMWLALSIASVMATCTGVLPLHPFTVANNHCHPGFLLGILWRYCTDGPRRCQRTCNRAETRGASTNCDGVGRRRSGCLILENPAHADSPDLSEGGSTHISEHAKNRVQLVEQRGEVILLSAVLMFVVWPCPKTQQNERP